MQKIAELIAPALGATEVDLGERYGLTTPKVTVVQHGVVLIESHHQVFSLSKYDLARILDAVAGADAEAVLAYVRQPEAPTPSEGF